MWLDSHAHIASSEFEDLDTIVRESRNNGVEKILIICCSLKEAKKAIIAARNDENLDVAVGFHPCDVHDLNTGHWAELEELVCDEQVVAVGEIGLDYYWNSETAEIQKMAFIRQIELANKVNKPIIVHSRDAIMDTYELMQRYPATKSGVLHCFSSSSEMAMKFVDLGYYISLAGPVTFKNAKTPKEVATIVPFEKLLIETDCPYLTPHPFRGKKNIPSYVALIGQEICKLRGISEDYFQIILNENYNRLFK